jgi:hypothetical protein
VSEVVNVRDPIEFPKICGRCCSPATQTLLIEHAFGNEADGFSVVRFSPFFCQGCLAEHWREAKQVRTADRLIAALKTEMTYAMLGPLLFGGFLMLQGLKSFAATGDPIRAGLTGFVGFVFILIGVGCFIVALRRTAYKAITPPTSVTGTIVFTDDLSSTFEPAWRRFTFHNANYAQAFIDLNRSSIWDRYGEHARKAASRRFNLKIVGYIALAVFVLYWVYDDLIRPYL